MRSPQVKGVTLAEDVTGPYDVIVRAEARNVDELGKLVVSEGAEPRRHHPHPDLPCRPHLTWPEPTGARAPGRPRPGARVRPRCRRRARPGARRPAARNRSRIPTAAPHRGRPGRLPAGHRRAARHRRRPGPAQDPAGRGAGRRLGRPGDRRRSAGSAYPRSFTRTSACTVADGVGWFVPESQVDDQSVRRRDVDRRLPPGAAGDRARVVPSERAGGRDGRARRRWSRSTRSSCAPCH